MGRLTALQVKNAKPGRYVDGQGLMLHVRESGSRAWVLRVQFNGKRRDFGLGSELSLTEAREKAAAWRKQAKTGKNPADEARKTRRPIPTFEEAAKQYHDQNKGGWRNAKHAAQWLATLERFAFPTMGRMLPAAIDAATIWAALAPIWQEKEETARRVRQRIATVLDYCHAKDWRDTEAPVRALASLTPKQGREPEHFPAMPYEQIPDLMAKLRAADQTTGRLALQFTILNAARSGETRAATWSEINLDRGEWKITPGSRKGKGLHIVPLADASLAILRTMAERNGTEPGDLIFPGAKKGRPMSDATLQKVLEVNGGAGYTTHGTARSGFRDWVAEMCPTVPGDVAEKALNHKVKDRVEAAYRRASYIEQRRKLMADWADYLSGESRKIVRLAG